MMVTIEEAKTLTCPLTIASDAALYPCKGPQCMAWRYRDHQTDDVWAQAVRKAAEELGDTSPSRTKATRAVMNNRTKYGLSDVPSHGWCGLAGKPEWWPKPSGGGGEQLAQAQGAKEPDR
jgi:hypothetical protein